MARLYCQSRVWPRETLVISLLVSIAILISITGERDSTSSGQIEGCVDSGVETKPDFSNIALVP